MTQSVTLFPSEPLRRPVLVAQARFHIGQMVRHAQADFVAVVMDVDAEYAGQADHVSAVWRHQPFYRLLVSAPDRNLLIYAPEDMLESHGEGQELAEEDREALFVSDAAGHWVPLGQVIQ